MQNQHLMHQGYNQLLNKKKAPGYYLGALINKQNFVFNLPSR
ncbi:hypothetical protein LDG_7322 [Legionella drancourtii LLAP12]|uniref:Uncharacterized protein n=1 Tax=Legionella drancourtii LLAP12 TaxID=658187 RepID=G9EPY1_9GAMM|nr:hypothetical protein LDG_7322 [Legionella drancourtii LLAP12]